MRLLKKENIPKKLCYDLTVKNNHNYFANNICVHNTNATITLKSGKLVPGKRTSFINIQKDNAGFAMFAAKLEQQLGEAFPYALYDDVVLYGEWIGPGVQKGVACSAIPEKVFVVFAIYEPKIGLQWKQYHPIWDVFKNILFKDVDGIYFLEPLYSEEIKVDFSDSEQVVEFQKKADALVESVCEHDPWVKETFGIDGFGEGVVYYSVETVTDENGEKHPSLFKVKGEKFQEVKINKPTDIDYEKINSLSSLAESLLTEHRMEKIFDAAEYSVDIRNIGSFLKEISNDVIKECQNEIIQSGYDWKDISRYVTKRAADFYKEKLKVVV